MRLIPVAPPSFGANCYLLASGDDCWIVDPSLSAERIAAAVSAEKLNAVGILLTHGHFDHTTCADALRDRLSCPLFLHQGDASMLTEGTRDGYFDFYGIPSKRRSAECFLRDEERLSLGDESITVLHTPGHSPGSVCFYWSDGLITGDTLFADSVGRCDLWGGDEEALRRSLKRLRTLPQDLPIFPGHGAPTLLGHALDLAAYYL